MTVPDPSGLAGYAPSLQVAARALWGLDRAAGAAPQVRPTPFSDVKAPRP